MIPLHEDPCFTFRFADPSTGKHLGLLMTATVGEGGWVGLAEPIFVGADEVFIAVPEQVR